MLTPMDIHNKDFKRAIRGYSTNEVDEFLDRIVSDYEKLFRENDKLKEQLSLNEKEISQFRKLEKNLQDTLVVAQNTADDLLATARQNAEKTELTAQKNADDITTTARQNADELLATTRKTVEEMKSSTERECRSIRERAKLDAERQMNEANNKYRTIIAEYEKLLRDKNSFLMKIRTALEAELAVTNQMLSSVPSHEMTLKAHSTTPTPSSPLSNVPLPTITPSNVETPSSPAPTPTPKPAPPSRVSKVDKPSPSEDLEKTSVFVKTPRVK